MTLCTTRIARRGAVVTGVLGGLFGALGTSPASAVPVSATLNYTCTFPLLKPQPLSLRITSDIPDKVAVNERTPAFVINAVAEVNEGAAYGLRAVETATIEGEAPAEASVTFPDGYVLPIEVPTTITKTTVPATGGFSTGASGKTPPLAFDEPGNVVITVKDVLLQLTPRLADGSLTGLDSFETECKQVPGQNAVLATIVVGNGDSAAPSKPGAPVGTPAPDSVSLSWGAANDNVGVTGYDVYRDGTKVQTVTSTTATVAGLTANTAYRFKVQARDAAGNVSVFSDETTVTTTGSGSANYGFTFTGAATIKTLTRGSVPLTGSITASVSQPSGSISGALSVNPATANLTALGFLPVVSKLEFAPVGPTTGTLKNGVLASNSKVRIKLPQVTLFGLPLGGGSACQTRSVSNIPLNSSGGSFDPLRGGLLTGTFTISDLTGCGALTGILSPLTAGSSNAIALQLTPKTTA